MDYWPYRVGSELKIRKLILNLPAKKRNDAVSFQFATSKICPKFVFMYVEPELIGFRPIRVNVKSFREA